jgi:hypothetical protein
VSSGQFADEKKRPHLALKTHLNSKANIGTNLAPPDDFCCGKTEKGNFKKYVEIFYNFRRKLRQKKMFLGFGEFLRKEIK